MKTHYFQRYHSKENVVTANAMLLLSRLYSHSPAKFFAFLQGVMDTATATNASAQDVELEIVFALQEKTANSVLDASITQNSFKVAIETKLNANFNLRQLANHLSCFGGEKAKVLLTLDPEPLRPDMAKAVEAEVEKCNAVVSGGKVMHKHMTFEELCDAVQSVLTVLDTDIQDILDD